MEYFNSHPLGEEREKVQWFHDPSHHVSKALAVFLAAAGFHLPASSVCPGASVKPQETSLPNTRELNASVKLFRTGSVLIMQRFQL